MYRSVCFTVNNYSEDERKQIIEGEIWEYVVVAREVGETGTPHLQGYGELRKRTSRNTVHRWFGGRAHCEERRGTQAQAVEYCKKDGDFEERGEARNQGLRGDLDRVRGDVLDVGMRGITRYANLQQIRVAAEFLKYNEPPRDWVPEVIWLWGPSGVGKSKWAREMLGEDVFVKSEGGKWWDGYDGHEDVILDDVRRDWFSEVGGCFAKMLTMFDRYECKAQCRNGDRQFLAKRIVVTCPWPPRRLFDGVGEEFEQLARRIEQIIQVYPEVYPEVGGVILEPPEVDIDLGL